MSDIKWDMEIQTMGLSPLELEAAAGLLDLNSDNSDKTQKQALLEIIEKKRQEGEAVLTPDQLETYNSIYNKLHESKKIGGYKKTKKRRRNRKKKLRKKTRKRKRKTKKKRKMRKRKTRRRR